MMKRANKTCNKYVSLELMLAQFGIMVNLIVWPFLQVRDLIHENINQYIGMCIESPNVCIVSIFCTRGSLQVNTISILASCDIWYICYIIHDTQIVSVSHFSVASCD